MALVIPENLGALLWSAVGVDPGISGAIGVVGGFQNDHDSVIRPLHVVDTPTITEGKKRELDLEATANAFLTIDQVYAPVCSAIEKVHAMPKQGVVSTFRFGQSYGAVQMAARGMGVPVFDLTPQAWKRYLKLAAGKDAARAMCKRLMPGSAESVARVKDEHRAEALLIAYCIGMQFVRGEVYVA